MPLATSIQVIYTRLDDCISNERDGAHRLAQVNFRVKDERLALIDRAAAIRGITRTEFVLRASEDAALEALNERPIIVLDDKAYDDFLAALETPDTPSARLRELAARQPPWDR